MSVVEKSCSQGSLQWPLRLNWEPFLCYQHICISLIIQISIILILHSLHFSAWSTSISSLLYYELSQNKHNALINKHWMTKWRKEGVNNGIRKKNQGWFYIWAWLLLSFKTNLVSSLVTMNQWQQTFLIQSWPNPRIFGVHGACGWKCLSEGLRVW